MTPSENEPLEAEATLWRTKADPKPEARSPKPEALRYPVSMRDSRGFTLIEMLIVLVIVGILLSIAISGYHAARIRGAESSAVSSLDSINKAQFAYAQTCGNQRYAPTLVILGTPVPGSGAPFLSPDLGQAVPLMKSGYVIQMGGTESEEEQPRRGCADEYPVPAYQVTADPINPGISGVRFFGTNRERLIFEDQATFVGNMPETGAPAHGKEIK
jgi:type IV pilus assembly protein PilA